MHFRFRGANDAFRGLVQAIEYPHSVPQGLETRIVESRAGTVKQVDEPITVTYSNPLERVLFNPTRDANPLFHVVESLWMLAGRNDVAPLAKYNSKIAEIASDDGETFNGAYGYRWRNSQTHWDNRYGHYTDQLKIIIDQLKCKPESRRCVLQMWNVEDDLLQIDETKDCCCNLSICFSLREEKKQVFDSGNERHSYLDMTVFNRSNDLTFGMLGANVVHFSFLLEYMAACIGVEVGVYNQITNNLHCYLDRWEPEKWLAEYGNGSNQSDQWYGNNNWSHVPLVKDPSVFDQECSAFVDNWKGNWTEPFLAGVAAPMCRAFELHKLRRYDEALAVAMSIVADDWRIASYNWIERRKISWENKQESPSES